MPCNHAGDALAKSQAAFWFWMQSFPNCSPEVIFINARQDVVTSLKACLQIKVCLDLELAIVVATSLNHWEMIGSMG